MGARGEEENKKGRRNDKDQFSGKEIPPHPISLTRRTGRFFAKKGSVDNCRVNYARDEAAQRLREICNVLLFQTPNQVLNAILDCWMDDIKHFSINLRGIFYVGIGYVAGPSEKFGEQN